MASLSHLIRFSSIGLLKPAALSSLRSPSPVPFSRLNPAGFLFSRAVQYATAADDAVPRVKARASPSAGSSGKITDEFTGAGAFGQASQMDGSEAQNTGSPLTYAAFPPAKNQSASPSGKITNEFTGAGAIGQRVLNTGSPITCAAAPAAMDPSTYPGGKITDDTGAGAVTIGQVCQVDGSEALVSEQRYAAGPCGKITNEFTEAGVIGQVCQYAAAPPAKDPSAGPSGKITDEFTGAAANEQDEQDETEEFLWEKYADEIAEALRHAAAGTSSADCDTPYPHPSPFTCLTWWDIVYGRDDIVYRWYK